MPEKGFLNVANFLNHIQEKVPHISSFAIPSIERNRGTLYPNNLKSWQTDRAKSAHDLLFPMQ